MQSFLARYSRYIGAFISIGILSLLIYHFSEIFTWITLAWVVSLLGSPIMKLLGKIRYKNWGIPSSVRALMVLGLFCGVFGLFLYLFVPVIIQQGRNFASVDYTAIVQGLEEPIAHFSDWLVEKGLSDGELSAYADSTNYENAIDTSQQVSPLSRLPKKVVSSTTINIDSIIQASGDTITKTNIHLNIALSAPNKQGVLPDSSVINDDGDSPFAQLRKKIFQYISPSQIITRTVFYAVGFFGNFLILITSVFFIAFFFLKDEELFGRAVKAVVPSKHLDKTDSALAKIKHLLTRYFSGILLQILFILLFLSLFLSFFGIPNTFLISFFAAAINVIPYLGPLIGASFAMLVTISSSLDLDFYTVTMPMLFQVAGVFAAMQLLDGFVIQPIIFSNRVSAHPLEIFIVIIVGAKLGGITGMVVAIPIYTIIRVIAAVFLQEFKLVQKLTESINPAGDPIHDEDEDEDEENEKDDH